MLTNSISKTIQDVQYIAIVCWE